MTKKRKLNSKNPKYMNQNQKGKKIIKRKELACTTSNGSKIYKVWYG
tara:strand:- start:5796 stop:5936 length:141 start_codon:yes stop_codon:yes gene_type:complete